MDYVPHSRVFSSKNAHGGEAIDPATTALVMIEFQNEFVSPGGKLHDKVKPIMESTGMLDKAVEACEAARAKGCTIIHSPIIFAADKSDNPNKGLGILQGCADGELFLEGTWNAEICDAMQPAAGDLILKGKKGLDAFPGTNLEHLLVENGIKTVVLGGLLTNCCVESTMRTAYEKGFNVITLTDCTATDSELAQTAVERTYPLFSKPVTKDEFLTMLSEAPPHGRVFVPKNAHGGEKIDPATTALVMIEFQNEFVTPGGKLHDKVKPVMESTGMLAKAVEACTAARKEGCKIIHSPITFAADKSDNPNKGLGILQGCADGELFLEGTWNAEICDAMRPAPEDLILKGKRGLDAFPGSNLEELLVENGIKTVVLGGLLTNCCVEGTMRTAYEKGYNVITLTDCTATDSDLAQKGAIECAYPLFSKPVTKDEFLYMLQPIVPAKTAIVMIEFQNEFASPGGKMYDDCQPVMESNGMLANAAEVCRVARAKGCQIVHSKMIFKDRSEYPNKKAGLLKACAERELFLEGTWGVEFCDAMQPETGDWVLRGKKGLDAFDNTGLAELLVQHGMETVVLGGFMTNGCVESTMRTAYDRDFRVFTLTDCTATTSIESQKQCIENAFPLCSTPVTTEGFLRLLQL